MKYLHEFCDISKIAPNVMFQLRYRYVLDAIDRRLRYSPLVQSPENRKKVALVKGKWQSPKISDDLHLRNILASSRFYVLNEINKCRQMM